MKSIGVLLLVLVAGGAAYLVIHPSLAHIKKYMADHGHDVSSFDKEDYGYLLGWYRGLKHSKPEFKYKDTFYSTESGRAVHK